MPEPIEQIWAEMGRRGLAGMTGPSPLGASTGSPGAAIGVAPRTPQPPLAADRALGVLLNTMPRVSVFARTVNAGPVADGTLDHARRMGWVK